MMDARGRAAIVEQYRGRFASLGPSNHVSHDHGIRFGDDRNAAPGGRLPVNTNGGGLSCCHPGMYGLFAIVEAVRQLRGDAAMPVDGVELALAHGNGGTLSSQATVILGGSATLVGA